jgi:uncharacterized protein YqhQ
LLGPILATSAIGNALATKTPMPYRAAARIGATFGSIALSTELFGWMSRNPEHPVARALQKPGHQIQEHLGTREPTSDQLEVAEAALRSCLALEEDVARGE